MSSKLIRSTRMRHLQASQEERMTMEQISFDDMPLVEGLMYCEVNALLHPTIKIGMSANRGTLKRRIASHARHGFRHSIDIPVLDPEFSERMLKGKLAEHVIAGTEWVQCNAYVAKTVYDHFATLAAAQPNPWAYEDALKRLRSDLNEMATRNAQGAYGSWH
jgi:hypothetical protein